MKKIEYTPGEKLGPYNIEFVKEVEPQIGVTKSGKKYCIRIGQFICPICQCPNIFTSFSHIKSGHTSKCRECANKLHIHNITGERFGHLAVLFLYPESRNGKIWCRVKCDCGRETDKTTNSVITNHVSSCGLDGCPYKNGRDKAIKDLSQEKFGLLTPIKPIITEEDFCTDNGRIFHCYPLSEYRGATWLCKCDCGNYCLLPRQSLTGLHASSCGCLHTSKGELKIKQILEELQLDYIQEYIPPNSKFYFRYDFFLPENNTYIEFDGEQHYHPIDFFGGKEGFEDLRYRDLLKNQYCLNNQNRLVRIPYTEYCKLTPSYLSDIINNRNTEFDVKGFGND